MLSGMAIRITFISAGGPIVTRATFMYPISRVVFSASKQKLSLRKIAREEESRVLSRYSRAHGLISFPWGVRDINQYVLRTRGGGGGGRRRVNVSFSSSSPFMERWNGREMEEGAASEGKARRSREGRRGVLERTPDELVPPFSRDIPLSSPLKSVSGPQVRFRISEIVAVGGTRWNETSIYIALTNQPSPRFK